MTLRILTAVPSSTGLNSCRDLPPFTLVVSRSELETARVFLLGGYARVAIQDFDRSVPSMPVRSDLQYKLEFYPDTAI